MDRLTVLQRFSERVEQAPHVASFKGIMPWFAPLLQHGWNETVTAYADIRGADGEVSWLRIRDLAC